MRAVTREQLAQRIRRRVNMEQSSFVDDDELRESIDEAVTELYDLLVAARGQEYYRATHYITAAPGQSVYQLPDLVYRLLSVAANDAAFDHSGHVTGALGLPAGAPRHGWHTLGPFMAQEIAGLLNAASSAPSSTRYRLAGHPAVPLELGGFTFYFPREQMELLPVPSRAFSLRLDYVPIPYTVPTSFDGEVPAGTIFDRAYNGVAGWEEYVVLSVSIDLLAKEESDTSALERKLKRTKERIADLADSRDTGRPERIVDVTGALDPLGDLFGVPRRPRDW